MAPGATNKFGAQWSNLSSFGSKFTVLKKVLVTLLGLFGASRSNSAPPQWFSAPHSELAPGEMCPPSLRPWSHWNKPFGNSLTAAKSGLYTKRGLLPGLNLTCYKVNFTNYRIIFIVRYKILGLRMYIATWNRFCTVFLQNCWWIQRSRLVDEWRVALDPD